MLLIYCVLFSAFPPDLRQQVSGSVAAGPLLPPAPTWHSQFPSFCSLLVGGGEEPAWAASPPQLEAEFPAAQLCVSQGALNCTPEAHTDCT